MSYCVIGKHGLIGAAIAVRLEREYGDVTSYPTDATKIVFHFGSYTHVDFERNVNYNITQMLASYAHLLEYCSNHGIPFVYASSALIYEKDTEFSNFKKTIEQLVKCYKAVSIGCRMFPIYGPGEKRTVISQWTRAMVLGNRPVVWGDGTQARDFTYVDDAAEQIIDSAFERRWESKIVDIGSGKLTVFNDIVDAINHVLGLSLHPLYVIRPARDYSSGIFCKNPKPTKVTLEQGIRYIVDSMQGDPA